MVSTGTGPNAIAIAGNAIALSQWAEHAVGATAFSLPAHPSHLPCMGISVAMAAAATSIALAWTTRTVNPVARATESTSVNSQRAVPHNMDGR
jgi:hypothetical protein